MSDQVEMVAEQEAAGTANGENSQAQPAMPEVAEPVTGSDATPAAEQAPAAEVVPAGEASPEAEPVAEVPVAEAPVADAPVADATATDATVAQEAIAEDVVVAEEAVAAEVAPIEATSEAAPVAAVADAVAAEDGPTEEGSAEAGVSESADAASEEAAFESMEATGDGKDGDRKGNVRILAVGQQVQGAVKRIADFGAFVDIGVGRDGLIHISELSVRRVGKVTDVLAEGQEVTAWIKKLDRERNRISLTLIDPNTKTIRDLQKDEVVQGTVTRIMPYGAFVDIGIGRDALLHVREMSTGYVAKPEDVVKVGDTIEARIIELSRRRGRVDLSLKGLRDEPEPETPAASAQPAGRNWDRFERAEGQDRNDRNDRPDRRGRQQESEPEQTVDDSIDEMEVLSPMELAFKRAMEAEGMEFKPNRKKAGKRDRRDRVRDDQDDIIARTLSQGGRK